MKLTDFVTNPSMTVAIIILTGLLFWGYGCPPQTKSLLEPGKKITRPELQVELDTIIATAEFRLADLDRQEQFRDIIFKNALLMVEGGALNPIGIATMLAGLYGVTRGAKDIKDRVKKKTNT
ncbi:hypothetical protein ES703_75289 [subsurface metagenome]